VSETGHLKIADFGLATSGEWIYQESYRSNRRKDLLRKYHRTIVEGGPEISVEESDEPHMQRWEKLNRMHANSIVGTYYYMAPEVLEGGSYNATADWYLNDGI
jgi:protein-serine/threonine kinase